MEDVTYSRVFWPRVKPFCATIRHTLTFFALQKCSMWFNSTVFECFGQIPYLFEMEMEKWALLNCIIFSKHKVVRNWVWICFSSTPEKSAHFQIMNGGEELDDCCRLHIRKIWEKVFGTLSLLLNDELTPSVANLIAESNTLRNLTWNHIL